MKFLLASVSKGRETSHFFADVVKNVAVKAFEVKRMVYIYLVHYADYNNECRELALLSINTFQNDMNGGNELFRAMALRVLTSINVDDIVAIQILAARKCSKDASPYVRKCAATALAKLYAMSYGSLSAGGASTEAQSPQGDEVLLQLKDILATLLADAVPMVLGSALLAYNAICPNDFDLLHKHFRKMCHLICDLNEWTQVAALDVITRYVRTQFTNPADKFVAGADTGGAARGAVSTDSAVMPPSAVAVAPVAVTPQYSETDFDLFGLPAATATTTTTAAAATAATTTAIGGTGSSRQTAKPPKRKAPVKAKVTKGFYSDSEGDGDGDGGNGSDSEAEVEEQGVDVGVDVGDTWSQRGPASSTRAGESVRSGPAKTPSQGQGQQWSNTGYRLQESELDPDYLLVLKCTSPLLRSCNASVILAVCGLHFYCCCNLVITHTGDGKTAGVVPHNSLYPISRALVRILRNRREVQFILLQTIRDMAAVYPVMFKDYLPSFYSTNTDPLFIRLLKLEILGIVSVCLSVDECRLLLSELQVYIRSSLPQIVCAACDLVTKTAKVAQGQVQGQGYTNRDGVSDVVPTCIQGLVHLLVVHLYTPVPSMSGYTSIAGDDCDPAGDGSADSVISACVASIRALAGLNKHNDLTLKVVHWLVKELLVSIHPSSVVSPGSVLDSSEVGTGDERSESGHGLALRHSTARSEVVLIVSEFRGTLWPMIPDILRCLAKSFMLEATNTKLQIMNLAIKVHLDMRMRGGSADSGVTTGVTGVNGFSSENSGIIEGLMLYILELARYDEDFDLRDRARVLTALVGLKPVADTKEAAMLELETENLSGVGNTSTGGASGAGSAVEDASLASLSELAAAALSPSAADVARILGPPPVRCTTMPSNAFAAPTAPLGPYLFGSLSHVVQHEVRGFRPLQAWQPPGGLGGGKSHGRQTSISSGLRNGSGASGTAGSGSKAAGNSGTTNEGRPRPYRDPTALNLADSSDSGSDTGGALTYPPDKYIKSNGDCEYESDSDSDSYSSGSYSSYTGSSDYSSEMDSDTENETEAPPMKDSHTVAGEGLISLIDTPSESGQLSPLASLSLTPAAVPALSQDQIYNEFLESFTPAATSTTVSATIDSKPSSSPVTGASGGVMLAQVEPLESRDELLSDSLVLLRPELAGGLSVSLVYIRKPSTAVPGAPDLSRVKAYIVVQNHGGERPIRRIRISFVRDLPTSGMFGPSCSCSCSCSCSLLLIVQRLLIVPQYPFLCVCFTVGIPDVPLLPVGHSAKLPCELNIAGIAPGTSFRVDIRCDSGAYTGTYSPGAREWLVPSVLTAATCEAIIAKGSKGGGFNTSTRTVTVAQLRAMWAANLASRIGTLPPGVSGASGSAGSTCDDDGDVGVLLTNLMCSLFNTRGVTTLTPAPGATRTSSESKWYFCATIRRGQGHTDDKVVFQWTAFGAATDSLEVKLFCDDVLQCTAFMQFLTAKVK